MKHVESGTVQVFATAPSSENRTAAKFEELVLPFMDSAYNLARWLTRNDHDAEDLLQETCLKALRKFHSFQQGTNFRAWMFRILRNTFLSSKTSRSAQLSTPLEPEQDWTELAVEFETPETIFMNRLDTELVYRAIDDLPIHYRETLLLCEMEEMSYREIAEIQSIPVGTVMSRLARARGCIRAFLLSTLAPRSQRDPDGFLTLEKCRPAPWDSQEWPGRDMVAARE